MSDWFKNAYNFIFNADTNSSDTPQTKKKIGVLRLAFAPFINVFDNFGVWLKIAFVYAAILSIISFGSGYSYICAYNADNNIIYCNNRVWLYWLYMIVKFVIFAFFIAEWIAISRGKKYEIAQSFMLSPQKLKTVFVLGGLFMLFGVGILSGYLLVISVPNPNWKIELSYFTIVSAGFLVPIFATRFYSLIAYAAEGKSFPPLKQIWKKTSGETIKILFSLFVILILMVFIIGNYIISVRYGNNGNFVLFAIIAEFLLNALTLLFWAVFANNCMLQTEMIEMEANNDE